MRLGETLGEAIETLGTWIKRAEEIGGDRDTLDNNRLVLSWLLELRARRKAMGREDDERNAAGDLCSCPGAGLQRWRELRGRPCLIHRNGVAHISEALRPLRERLARQTEAAQAEVVAELAAMRDAPPIEVGDCGGDLDDCPYQVGGARCCDDWCGEGCHE